MMRTEAVQPLLLLLPAADKALMMKTEAVQPLLSMMTCRREGTDEEEKVAQILSCM
jgi:hypothetical protein